MAEIPPNPANAIKLKLKSRDGAVFDVDKAVATQINFVKGMLEGKFRFRLARFFPSLRGEARSALTDIFFTTCSRCGADVAEQDGMEIPMGEVDARILAKVVEYCKFHHHQETNQTTVDEKDRWEKNFVQVDKSTLFQLILVRCAYHEQACRCAAGIFFWPTLIFFFCC